MRQIKGVFAKPALNDSFNCVAPAWRITILAILYRLVIFSKFDHESPGSYKTDRMASFLPCKKKGLVTIAAHKLTDDIAPGTLNSIFKQAQIDKR